MYRDRDPFLRNSDGLIDFDRYRSESYALRRQALQETSKLSAAFKLAVIVGVLLGAVAVAPSRPDANATCRTCTDVNAAADANASSARARHPSARTVLPEYPPLY
jgi:hypothetical protein